ncbi:MAG TPA: polysaccharide biosynthesis/export family protein [Opitutaceae bacterium]|nr:polysaccharide biosynthesis/export family protein [Opitutaceae bacterium]
MSPRLRLFLPILAAAFAVAGTGCFNNPMPVARPATFTALGTESAALQTAPVAPLDPALLRPTDTVFHLGPGDQLDIEVMGEGPTRSTVTVGPDGKIYYYLLPGLDVWGLTLPEVRDRLATEMQHFVREKPVVAVTLHAAASERVWVLGRVQNPGIYSLAGPTTLLDAVAQAGGLSASSPYAAFAASLGVPIPPGAPAEAADLSHSFIIRHGQVLPVDFKQLLRDGQLSQNIYLQPDDFIFLPSVRTPQVHILGAVNQPHSEIMAGSLTVIQAIALAAGTEPEACLSNVAVLRGSLAHPQIAIVPVDEILAGRAPDVRLEPGDIVYVPYRPERILDRYVNLILDTFARTVGINAGARIVSGNSTPIGIGVTVSTSGVR